MAEDPNLTIEKLNEIYKENANIRTAKFLYEPDHGSILTTSTRTCECLEIMDNSDIILEKTLPGDAWYIEKIKVLFRMGNRIYLDCHYKPHSREDCFEIACEIEHLSCCFIRFGTILFGDKWQTVSMHVLNSLYPCWYRLAWEFGDGIQSCSESVEEESHIEMHHFF
jgi:hypothetical protein